MAEAIYVVLLGGDGPTVGPSVLPPDLVSPDLAAGAATVVAADSGQRRAAALGLRVDHLVGDLDSLRPDEVARAEAAGTTVHRHPADKDATDAELAVDLAERLRATAGHDRARLLVIGEATGRLDLLLADVALLASARTTGFAVTAHLGSATLRIARPGRPVTVVGTPGEQVSLLPCGGEARGVTTEGLRWPLLDATLAVGTTRGVSNELVGREATVAVGVGTLAVVQPGTVGATPADRLGPYDPSPR